MSIKDFFKSRKMRDFVIGMASFLPDRPYIKLFFWAATGRRLNLENPTGISEKLNWLKLNWDYSPYTDYCDKIKLHDIINEKLGEGYMFPLIGKWKTFEEIDFDSLPNEFVLKCNHDSGSTKIVKDKSALTSKEIKELKNYFNKRVNYDFYKAGREPGYKGIDRYIIAEKFMKDTTGEQASINDIKFHCFNGKPEIVLIASDKDKEPRYDYFDMDYNHLDISIMQHSHSDEIIKKPSRFEEMKKIAEKLSQGFPYVRIDLYEIDGKIYFGEYTFFAGGGFDLFNPYEYELKLGKLIDINEYKQDGKK